MKASLSLCFLSSLLTAVFATPTLHVGDKRTATSALPATTTINLGYTVHQGTLNVCRLSLSLSVRFVTTLTLVES